MVLTASTQNPLGTVCHILKQVIMYSKPLLRKVVNNTAYQILEHCFHNVKVIHSVKPISTKKTKLEIKQTNRLYF